MISSTLFQRLRGKRNSQRTSRTVDGRRGYRGLRIEPLEQRSLLSATTTVLTSVPQGDLVYGQNDVLTAAVTSSGQPVTGGNVDFFLDGSATAFARLPVDVGPSASTATTTVPNLTTVPTLAVGTHTFTATYEAFTDPNGNTFESSVSTPVTQTVNQASTQTTLTASPNPGISGQPVTLTSTVTVVSPGSGQPTANVQFLDGTTVLGTAALNSADTAVLSTSVLTVGVHNLTAVYQGDTNFASSTSPPVTETIAQATTTRLVVAPGSAAYHHPVTFVAHVQTGVPGVKPAGAVTFTATDSAGTVTTLATVPINAGGIAKYQSSTLPPGTFQIAATFVPTDPNKFGGSSDTASEIIRAPRTMTKLSAPRQVQVGQYLTLTVKVMAPSAGIPTGTVTLMLGGSAVGAITLDSSGTATFQYTPTAAGNLSFQAVFTGSGAFSSAGSQSQTLTMRVTGKPGGGSGHGHGVALGQATRSNRAVAYDLALQSVLSEF